MKETVLISSAGNARAPIESAVLDGTSSRARVLEAMEKIGLAGVVVAVVLLGYTPSTLRIFYVVLAGSIGLYIAARGEGLLRSLPAYLHSGLLRWRWAFLLWASISLFWSSRAGFGVERVVTMLEIHLLGLVFYDAARTRDHATWVLKVVFVVATAGCAYAFADGTMTEAGRLVGAYGNPNVLAMMALAGLALFCAGVDVGKGVGARLLSYIMALCLLAGVLASSSRKGILGVVVIWGLGMLHRRTRGRTVLHIAAGVGSGGLLLLVSDEARIFWQMGQQRVVGALATLTTVGGSDNSIVARSTFIRDGVRLISESPVFGHGLGAFRWLAGDGSYAHSNFIELGVSLGLVGLILYYGFHAAVFMKALVSGERASVVRTVVLILLPMIIVLDIAVVSYYMKLPVLLTILCAGWFDRSADETRPAPSFRWRS